MTKTINFLVIILILSVLCSYSAQDNSNTTTSGNETVIIEKKQIEPNKTQQVQRKNFVEFRGKRYIFELNRMENWFFALSACRRNGTILAHIDSPELMKVINDYLMSLNTTQKFWIAANTLAKKAKLVKEFSGEPLNYTNWAEGQPDLAADNARCVVLGLNHMSTQYFWYGRNCNDNLHYICVRTIKIPVRHRQNNFFENIANFFRG